MKIKSNSRYEIDDSCVSFLCDCQVSISKSQVKVSDISVGAKFYYLVDGCIAVDEIKNIYLCGSTFEIEYSGDRHSFRGEDIGSTVFFFYDEACSTLKGEATRAELQTSKCTESSLELGELAIINAYTAREVSEDDAYVFSMVLCDNDIDKDNERFTLEALETLSTLFTGKTGIVDEYLIWPEHFKPRIFICGVKPVSDKANALGCQLYQLVAKAYILKVPETAAIRDAISSGRITEVSIGCSTSPAICSICGNVLQNCDHVPGRQYGFDICHGELRTPKEAYEFAFVPSRTSTSTDESDG